MWIKTRTPPRLSAAQISTGDRYATTYRAAHRDTLSTSANDNGMEPALDPVEALRQARQRLSRVQRHIIDATGSDRLVALLDAICGRGETIRAMAGNDDRLSGAYGVELRLALDMAGVAFKVGKREDAA